MTRVKRRSRNILVIAMCLVVGSLGVGAVAFMRSFLAGSAPPAKKVVQEIQLIRPPPPPDLPPPPPPPPEVKQDIPDPQQKPDTPDAKEAPPAQQLGLDTEGGAGGDAFGLVGNKGGHELVGSGGSIFAWYAGLLKNEIVDQLSDEQQVRNGQYGVTVRIWVREDGTVDHVQIVGSSGDRERDRIIEAKLSRISRLSQGPPADMPQPISVHIGTHS
jgi:periplasmic protein TonB